MRIARLACAALVGALGCGARANGPPPLPSPVVVAGALDGRALLVEAATHAADAGAGPLSIVASGETAERERMGAFVAIPEGLCLLGFGRASSSVEDLDLAAFADDGTPLAVDDGPDPHPTLLLCPPHPPRVYLASVTAAGEGLVAVGAELVLPARAAAVAKAMNAHGTRPVSSRAAEAWPGLDDHVRKHHEGAGVAWEVFRKTAVAVDARVPAAVGFPVESEGCTDALIVPDDDVGALDVEARDDRGRLVARGGTSDRDRVVTVCSPTEWIGTLSVRPHVGQGLVAVVLSRARGDAMKRMATLPDIAWGAATETAERARARRDAELEAAGYARTATGSATGTLVLGASHSTEVRLAPPAGAAVCARIDVLGGAPTAFLSAAAWDDTGVRLAASEGSTSATVFACGARSVRLDVDARARPGPFVATWRPERWADRAFATYPRAAARMLTRLASGPSASFEGEALGVRAVALEASHEASWTEVLPAGACVHVGVGAEGEGAGLVGRVIDVATGDELDRAHAADAIAFRACAPLGSLRTVGISVAVTAGKLGVVVGERIVK